MENLFNDFVLDERKKTNEYRQENDEQAANIIREIRRKYGSMTYVEIRVMVAICTSCKGSEASFIEEQLPHPHVFCESWQEDYANLGIPRKFIRKAKQAFAEGIWSGVDCFQCGSTMPLEGGEPFYVTSVHISEYFGLNDGESKKPPRWMKDIILSAFKYKCAECKKKLKQRDITFDHIIPLDQDGMTEMDNLQPMCKRCNQEKGNSLVKTEVHPSLIFPMLPPTRDY